SSNGTGTPPNGLPAINGTWQEAETPTSPNLPHPTYQGTTWSSSGFPGPFYQIGFRRTMDVAGVLTIGGTDAYTDDTMEVFVNGTRVYARIPDSNSPLPAIINVAADDEVEVRYINLGFIGGYYFTLEAPGVDCSDLPEDGSTAPDGTTSATAYGNAPHLVGHAGTDIYLGTDVDTDASGVSSADAAGDSSDDDGISAFPALSVGDSTYSIPANNITATGTGTLHAWLDFNGNGILESTEYATVNVNAGVPTGSLDWTGQNTVSLTSTFVRFRFTSDSNIDASAPTGLASDGEVEDYQLPVATASDPNVLLVKRITGINGNNINNTGSTPVPLNTYNQDPTSPYDDNVLDGAASPKDTDKWPNTTSDTASTLLIGARDGGVTKPGDEIEYTIYFLSAGDEDAQNVQFCDRIPDGQTFIPDSFNNDATTTPDADGIIGQDLGIVVSHNGINGAYTNIGGDDEARFYPPGSGLPPACNLILTQTEHNGAIVVDLGNLPKADSAGSPVGSYGYVRFRAKVD
ncbi:MAG: DUF11 domain-containing protein, partial [Anaerolineae bacterium]|nr:DUF11 domain-containing protein [Anaerolineae bacterium]